jgi:hypothetical protein
VLEFSPRDLRVVLDISFGSVKIESEVFEMTVRRKLSVCGRPTASEDISLTQYVPTGASSGYILPTFTYSDPACTVSQIKLMRVDELVEFTSTIWKLLLVNGKNQTVPITADKIDTPFSINFVIRVFD